MAKIIEFERARKSILEARAKKEGIISGAPDHIYQHEDLERHWQEGRVHIVGCLAGKAPAYAELMQKNHRYSDIVIEEQGLKFGKGGKVILLDESHVSLYGRMPEGNRVA